MDRKNRRLGARRLGALVAVFALIVVVVATAGQAKANKQYVLGISNTLVGNGWREGMLCSIKAQARKSGEVSSLKIAHRATDTAGQISDIKNMISAGVDGLIINPSSATALIPVTAQARAKGIQVVFIDQKVNAPGAYNATNDQTKYAFLGATWLFKKLGGQGNVVEMRGYAGVPADTDRHKGFQAAAKAFPKIKIVKSIFTDWSFTKAGQQMIDLLNSGLDIDGVWTSGTDYTVVDAFKKAGKPYVPIVGADNYGFIRQVKSVLPPGMGAAVTNPASIGGAGVTQVLSVLDGKTTQKWIKLDPKALTWPKDKTQINKFANPKAPPDGSATLQLPPWTTYTLAELKACQGP